MLRGKILKNLVEKKNTDEKSTKNTPATMQRMHFEELFLRKMKLHRLGGLISKHYFYPSIFFSLSIILFLSSSIYPPMSLSTVNFLSCLFPFEFRLQCIFFLSFDFVRFRVLFFHFCHWCEDFDELILKAIHSIGVDRFLFGVVTIVKMPFYFLLFCSKAYAFSVECHTSKSNPWCSLFKPNTIKSDILLNVKPVKCSVFIYISFAKQLLTTVSKCMIQFNLF